MNPKEISKTNGKYCMYPGKKNSVTCFIVIHIGAFFEYLFIVLTCFMVLFVIIFWGPLYVRIVFLLPQNINKKKPQPGKNR